MKEKIITGDLFEFFDISVDPQALQVYLVEERQKRKPQLNFYDHFFELESEIKLKELKTGLTKFNINPSRDLSEYQSLLIWGWDRFIWYSYLSQQKSFHDLRMDEGGLNSIDIFKWSLEHFICNSEDLPLLGIVNAGFRESIKTTLDEYLLRVKLD